MNKIIFFFILIVIYSCTNYNVDKADTPANKRGFKNIVDVPLTPDVKQIYFYVDEFIQDPSYQLSFKCNQNTLNAIVIKHELTKEQKDTSTFVMPPGYPSFFWWDNKKLTTLEYHWKLDDRENEKLIELWYDPKDSTAYFIKVYW